MAQLGNLHRAGQELAEAMERAARAETEVAFLKERLYELHGRESEEREPMLAGRRRSRFDRSCSPYPQRARR